MTRPPIRIAQVVGNLETGGTQTLMIELMRRLDRSRFDPVLLYFKQTNHYHDEIQEKGWECHRVPLSRQYRPRELRNLSRFLVRERIDIVHCHSDHAIFGARTAALMAGVPHVLAHYHNTYEHRINRAFVRADSVLAEGTDAYVGCSEGVCEFLSQNLELRGRPVRLLRNGVHLSPYLNAGKDRAGARARLGVDPDVFHIVHTARLEPHKQPQLLLEAIAQAERAPDTPLGNWRLTFVGGGSLREELEAMVRRIDEEGSAQGRRPMAQRVHFAGWSTDVAGWLATADVYPLVSRNEGFSLSLVEAMAAGTPTIAGDIVGPREVVGAGENGLLVDVSSADGVLSALLRYRRDPEFHRRVSQNGLARALLFSIDSFIEDTESLYDELSSTSSPGPSASLSAFARFLLPYRMTWLAGQMKKSRGRQAE